MTGTSPAASMLIIIHVINTNVNYEYYLKYPIIPSEDNTALSTTNLPQTKGKIAGLEAIYSG
jgi:hypothetical protein